MELRRVRAADVPAACATRVRFGLIKGTMATGPLICRLVLLENILSLTMKISVERRSVPHFRQTIESCKYTFPQEHCLSMNDRFAGAFKASPVACNIRGASLIVSIHLDQDQGFGQRSFLFRKNAFAVYTIDCLDLNSEWGHTQAALILTSWAREEPFSWQ